MHSRTVHGNEASTTATIRTISGRRIIIITINMGAGRSSNHVEVVAGGEMTRGEDTCHLCPACLCDQTCRPSILRIPWRLSCGYRLWGCNIPQCPLSTLGETSSDGGAGVAISTTKGIAHVGGHARTTMEMSPSSCRRWCLETVSSRDRFS